MESNLQDCYYVLITLSAPVLFSHVVNTHKNSIRKINSHHGPYPPSVFHIPIHFLELKLFNSKLIIKFKFILNICHDPLEYPYST